MYKPTFKITAYDNVTAKRIHLFTWTRTAQAGIEKAKSEAAERGLEKYLQDYRAEAVSA